ncbi:hypothetical protein ABAC460_16840 [Asticcacaulis sp. AC460]|uniref:hypothetical protein n=1 Tax=Asticcacaulis sp. AC460 TaxID=1282360 RepID=UPI0003C3B8E9|nr:hypothetical protein [Asticcacaulis sp. AC460]ESQ88326.1 hypothetical protein ABAC460_16840 [Asticcacaulis sp. AC460]
MRTTGWVAVLCCLGGCATGPGDAAKGFHGLFLHDACVGENTAQPDTCLHDRRHESSFVFGGKTGASYDVTLRVRGLFEPTTMDGGAVVDPAHPYWYTGGQTRTPDYSQWRIDVSSPQQSYTLNNYPSVSHTIYKEDFEAVIRVDAGATVTVLAIDGNDRQIDNGAEGRADRQQVIEGVTDTPLPGQMVRLDVVRVEAR